MTSKIYDLGVNIQNVSSDSAKVIAWPMQAWCCVVPDNINRRRLNLLEKLILNLINDQLVESKTDIKVLLCDKMGLDGDLIENVFDGCLENKGYISKRDNILKLNQAGKDALKADEEEISPDMEFSEEMIKVYLFQDLVANTIIPYFGCDELPTYYEQEEDVIDLSAQNVKPPTTAEIMNALWQWGKIKKEIDNGDEGLQNTIPCESKSVMDVKDADEAVIQGERQNDEPQSFDKGSRQSDVSFLTIYSEEPIKINAKAYVSFNYSNPEQLEIISPFGTALNGWFARIVNRARKTDARLDEELKFFAEDKREEFKDKIAFDNSNNIKLFDEIPPLCNDDKYKELKKVIINLFKDVERFKNGEDETDNFIKNLRVAIEILFRTVTMENEAIFDISYEYFNLSFCDYCFDIESCLDGNSLSDQLAPRYKNKGIFENIINCTDISGVNTKIGSALMMLYAQKNRNSKVAAFIKNYPQVILDAYNLTNLGNRASHGSYGNSITVDDAKRNYAKYEAMVKLLYEELIKE